MSIISAITTKLNNAKPSNLDDETRETFRRRITHTAAFVAGVLATATTVATVSYYKSFEKTGETTDITFDEN